MFLAVEPAEQDKNIKLRVQQVGTAMMKYNVRGMAGKLVDTISIFNRKRNSVKMNISGFAKIFHEQIDEIL